MLKNSYPHVSVVAPISDKKSYIIDKWLNHIFSLTYPNFSIVLVDNSKTKDLYKRLKSQYPEITQLRYFNPKMLTSPMYIAHSQNIMVAEARKLNAKFIMSIECDVFPPENIIELLMAKNVPVASGVYPCFEGVERKPLFVTLEGAKTGHLRQRRLEYVESLLLCNGKDRNVFGNGIGCTLIDISIFKFLNFRYQADLPKHHSDSFFYQDLYDMGVDPVVDTSIICRHESSSWNETNKEDEELLSQIYK